MQCMEVAIVMFGSRDPIFFDYDRDDGFRNIRHVSRIFPLYFTEIISCILFWITYHLLASLAVPYTSLFLLEYLQTSWGKSFAANNRISTLWRKWELLGVILNSQTMVCRHLNRFHFCPLVSREHAQASQAVKILKYASSTVVHLWMMKKWTLLMIKTIITRHLILPRIVVLSISRRVYNLNMKIWKIIYTIILGTGLNNK